MNRHRPYSKIAVFSAIWVLLTTPLTTYPLLELAARPGSPVARWMEPFPYVAVMTIEGLFMILPPVIGILFGALALRLIRGSWTPINGTGYARTGLTLGVISALCATGIFVAGLLGL